MVSELKVWVWFGYLDRLLIFTVLSILYFSFRRTIRSITRTVSTSLSDARCQAIHLHALQFALIFMLIFTRWCLYQCWMGYVRRAVVTLFSLFDFVLQIQSEQICDVWTKIFLAHAIERNDSHCFWFTDVVVKPRLWSIERETRNKHFFIRIILVKNYHWKIKQAMVHVF